MEKIKVMSVFGTRPETIKMAPLVKELERREEFESLVCVTAQHRQMLDSVLDIFHLKPDYDLNIMEPRQTLSTITTKCLLGMEGVLEEAKPDLVLVHGDTSTTFAGALAATMRRSPPPLCTRTGKRFLISPMSESMPLAPVKAPERSTMCSHSAPASTHFSAKASGSP